MHSLSVSTRQGPKCQTGRYFRGLTLRCRSLGRFPRILLEASLEDSYGIIKTQALETIGMFGFGSRLSVYLAKSWFEGP
jgi:hypothetical protein